MKLKKKKPTVKKVLTTCCWCDKKIGENQELFALGCKKRPGVDISKYEGGVMSVTIVTIGKTIWAIVPSSDSDARKDGKDFMFTLCSKECGFELKEALEQEKDIGNLLYSAELN